MSIVKDPIDELLRTFCLEADVRALEDKPLKAAYFLLDYDGNLEISNRRLAKFFVISTSQIRKGLWAFLRGHTSLDLKRSDYLAPMYEALLADFLIEQHLMHNGKTKDELQKRIPKNQTNTRLMKCGLKWTAGLTKLCKNITINLNMNLLRNRLFHGLNLL